MTRTKRFDWFIPALQISECTTPMCRAALQIATPFPQMLDPPLVLGTHAVRHIPRYPRTCLWQSAPKHSFRTCPIFVVTRKLVGANFLVPVEYIYVSAPETMVFPHVGLHASEKGRCVWVGVGGRPLEGFNVVQYNNVII